MHSVDYLVFVLYVLGMVGVALLFYRKNNSVKEMFAAGGQSPWWVSGLSGYMTLFSAGTFVVWGGLAYKHGAVAISINMASGIGALLVGVFVAHRWKALNILTPAEFIELRFGRAALHYYTWMLMFVRVVGCAVALYALSKLLHPLLPSITGDAPFDAWLLLVVTGLIIIAYTIVGGLWAVLMTDVLQFIILTVAVVFTVWLSLARVDDITTFAASVPTDFLHWSSNGYTWLFLLGWVVIHLFMLGAEWAFVQRYIAVPTRKDATKAALLFGGLYIVSPALWLLPALIYRSINPDAEPEQAYIAMSQMLLPIGMLGLVAAAMFSATASMISSQVNVFAGVLTENIFRTLLKQHNSEKHTLWFGRLSAAVLGGLIIVLASVIPFLGGAESVIFSLMSLFISPLFAPALWGLFSKRIDSSAIWATAAASAVIGFFFKFALARDGLLGEVAQLENLVAWRENHLRMMDIIAGVVTPLIVLCIAECVARAKHATPPRSQLLQQQAENPVQNTQSADNVVPLKIVTYSVLMCAVITGSITIINLALRIELTILTMVLLCLSGGLYVVLQRVKHKKTL